jgi:hypothetical protein
MHKIGGAIMADIKAEEIKQNTDNMNKAILLKSGVIPAGDLKGVPEFKKNTTKSTERKNDYKIYMVDKPFTFSQMDVVHHWAVGRVFSEQNYNLSRLLNLGLKCHEIEPVSAIQSERYGY